ncbi:MAG: sulfatase-like hydrolase/transferase [Bryobacterales bacterium]|nr:sulfatase-like hydrolase/transferase [Acidobacteriota bacterium]MCB9385533.1 sulfatase-like hydrolase/transferase [Bryobacterales bacterium]
MSRPNVLLISTDHWPAALLGEAGHRSILTPTLDELARSGVRFTNAYGECPVCIPARRTLMTGSSPRAHGDRDFGETKPMPNLPTMAQTFRDAGYQAYAVGKLHVYPQRNRIGFDDVILDEEGRTQYGVIDDYELFLGDQGYPGQQFDHGMSNNDYQTRPWHLPEAMHATNWATQQMVRTIKRRDRDRPSFWFLSYRHPHPPLVPVQDYLDMYDGADLGEPSIGEWTRGELPFLLQAVRARAAHMTPRQIALARKAFYALCTHIDHQLRVLIGSLREEDALSNTVICFTSDHGDMLGNHGMWAKKLFYEPAANIPMILAGAADDPRVGHHRTDDRIVGWQDVMPTLLDLAGIEIPSSVEGLSMVGDRKREYLYGEVGEGGQATRMIRQGDFKLIYYPVGNTVQLFDVEADPREGRDLSGLAEHAGTLADMTAKLIAELYGGDEAWAQDGKLVGLPNRTFKPGPNRGLASQRGHHWPPPPKTDMQQIVWHVEDNKV